MIASTLAHPGTVPLQSFGCAFIMIYMASLLACSFSFRAVVGENRESHIWTLLLIENSSGPQDLPRRGFFNPWLLNTGCA